MKSNSEDTIFKTNYEISIFIINSIIDSIDKMVNKGMLDVYGDKPDQNIMFHTSENHNLFYILLVDFLSPFDKSLVNLSNRNTPITNLNKIVSENYLNLEEVNDIENAIKKFKNWLEKKKDIEIWLSTIRKKSIIKLSRLEMIKACGIITKHNAGKLNTKFSEMLEIFRRTDLDISKEDIILEYKKFYERFHDDVLLYHSSYIVEMLIKIRWSIYHYLKPIFEKSIYYVSDGMPGQYRYKIPKEIKTEFMEIIFWELMNRLRDKPYMENIETTKYLKLRY